jgi:hypothetical protein
MSVLESDLGIYVVSGAFAILVFVVALALLATLTAIDLTAGTIATFTVGFLLFMGMYFTAMAVYRGIEKRENVE